MASAMNAWFHIRTRLLALIGIALALAGVALIVQLAVLLVWQYSIAFDTRSWPRLPAALLFTDHSQLAPRLAPLLPYIPEIHWRWFSDSGNASNWHTLALWLADKLHLGALPALLGLPLMLAGWSLTVRQRNLLTAVKRHITQREADRQRRIGEYRRQQERAVRVEPALEREDTDLIEAAESAWRRERVRALR